MRGLGQIAWLASFARPDVALITNIAPVHLELVGTVENVARAKAELIEALPPGGTAVVPEEPLLEPYLTRTDIEIRRFGHVEEPGRLPGRRPRRSASRRATPRATSSTTRSPRSTVCDVLGIPLEDGRARGRVLARCARRSSSSPDGVLADQRLLQREPALDARRARSTSPSAPATRRARRGARRDGRARRGGGRRTTASVGEAVARGRRRRARSPSARSRASTRPPRTASRRATRDTAAEAADALAALLRPGDVVLVKGSRAVGLEAVAAKLTRLDGTASSSRRSSRSSSRSSPGPFFIDFLRRHALGQHDPRGGAAAPLGEAGHADDGRRPDRDRGVDRVPRARPSTRCRR